MNDTTQATHTPGPLRAEPIQIGGGAEWTVVDPEPGFVIGIAVANIEHGVVAPAEANARLWAAAPDLKDVVANALNVLGGWREVVALIDDMPKNEAVGSAMWAVLNQMDMWKSDARSALSKATGVQ